MIAFLFFLTSGLVVFDIDSASMQILPGNDDWTASSQTLLGASLIVKI